MFHVRDLREAMKLHEEEDITKKVYVDGDYVVVVKKEGKEKWKPLDWTSKEVVQKFYDIHQHAEGRAWQYLKGIAKDGEIITEAFDNKTDCPYTNEIAILANSEEEAISLYNSAITYFNNSDLENKEQIIEMLEHIRDEELEHIDELKGITSLLNPPLLPEEGENSEENNDEE